METVKFVKRATDEKALAHIAEVAKIDPTAASHLKDAYLDAAALADKTDTKTFMEQAGEAIYATGKGIGLVILALALLSMSKK
jgi:hypothetical protein